MMRRFASATVASVILTWSASAQAHEIGLSTAQFEFTADAEQLEGSALWTFAHGDVLHLVPSADLDHNRQLSAAELHGSLEAIARALVSGLTMDVCVDGGLQARALSGSLQDDGSPADKGVEIGAELYCALGPAATRNDSAARDRLGLGYLAALPFGHRQVVGVGTATNGDEGTDQSAGHCIAHRGNSSCPIVGLSDAASAQGGSTLGQTIRGYGLLGIEHIVGGIDHLLFLLALVLLGGSWRSLLKVISAFTVAHSLTLSLGMLQLVVLDGVWVEAIIAGSVIYVGVENFFIRSTDKRWRIALLFGLLHGFGFAGALAETGLPAESAGWALAAFNGGVEVGQLALMTPLFLVVRRLRTRVWFTHVAVRSISAAIACMGLVWLVDRVS